MAESTRNLHICFERKHLQRTVLITLIVGAWLTLMNHLDLLLAGGLDPSLYAKIVLNYATPFVVANAGLLSRRAEPH
ncbi:hypothetical protein ACFQGT_18380 [Natrialbaceae archaeon GCM10025810]|uniref:hypothetical protein n=1 Tax=Halovalidus salilacus TaxID=3075124 RepID=UPI0036100EE0